MFYNSDYHHHLKKLAYWVQVYVNRPVLCGYSSSITVCQHITSGICVLWLLHAGRQTAGIWSPEDMPSDSCMIVLTCFELSGTFAVSISRAILDVVNNNSSTVRILSIFCEQCTSSSQNARTNNKNNDNDDDNTFNTINCHILVQYTCTHAHTHIQPFYGPLGFCLRLSGWASTRKVKSGR